MKLYFTKGACSLAVHIIINEMGLNCDYESVDLRTKKTADGNDYLAINSKGAVPALELDTKEFITENLIIQQYLVDTFRAIELCPPVGDLQRYVVLGWSNYISTEIHKSFSNLFNPAIPKDMQEKIFIPLVKAKLSLPNKQLGKYPYLTGNHFTMPDAYLFVMLSWAENMKIDLQNLPNLHPYFVELQKRPSIQKSLKEEGLV